MVQMSTNKHVIPGLTRDPHSYADMRGLRVKPHRRQVKPLFAIIVINSHLLKSKHEKHERHETHENILLNLWYTRDGKLLPEIFRVFRRRATFSGAKSELLFATWYNLCKSVQSVFTSHESHEQPNV